MKVYGSTALSGKETPSNRKEAVWSCGAKEQLRQKARGLFTAPCSLVCYAAEYISRDCLLSCLLNFKWDQRMELVVSRRKTGEMSTIQRSDSHQSIFPYFPTIQPRRVEIWKAG